MIFPHVKCAVGAAAILFCAVVLTSTTGTRAQEPEGNFGVGIPDVFLPKYLAYRTDQLASGSPDVMRVQLGYVKGLSRSFTSMVGEAAVNLDSGAFDVSLNGLTPLVTYTVWLVDRPESGGLPDTVFGLITFLATGPTALVTRLLPINLLPPGFTIDRIVVTDGTLWGAEPLGAGTVNVFQKIFFRRLSLVNDSSGEILFDEVTSPPALFELVPDLASETDALSWMVPRASPPTLRFATFSMDSTPFLRPVRAAARQSGGGSLKLDRLISQGADLFFNNTFGGNGRTCGTCHPVSNNLTIDKPFIATRPANDPLFVAEFNPALRDLERPALMREFGLILENLDGFVPASRFVMRGVPHTLGLQVSLQRDRDLPNAPVEMTGWSGDGAPGTGSLREFAIGAVTQHFPKRLNRVAGTDFVVPREHQLDAMEAFQLSTGRKTDIPLANVTFTDATVNTGKNLFINGGGTQAAGGTCNFCHTNAGALSAGNQNDNVNFNTNIEDVPHPARSTVQNFPKDGGFGRTPNTQGRFGDLTFNTPPLVEAADTAPFFHNNLMKTIEEAIDFYSSDAFNDPRAPAARFDFSVAQRDKIADFLRGVNTLQNIDVGSRELQEILSNRSDPRREQDTRLQTAFDETQDSIDVLIQGAIFPSARTRLLEARNLISQAQHSTDSGERRSLVQQAITKLGQARSAVASGPKFS